MQSLPVTVNLNAYGGDSWAQTFVFKDGDALHDLTGATIASWVRNPAGTTTHLVVSVDDPTNGEVTIGPPSGGLPSGIYAYDVEVDDTNGVLTWVKGQLSVEGDVTNAT
jgi:hypothetical protein